MFRIWVPIKSRRASPINLGGGPSHKGITTGFRDGCNHLLIKARANK